MKIWIWRIRRMAGQLGLPWLGAIAVAVLAAGFELVAVLPARQSLDALTQRVAGLQVRHARDAGRAVQKDPALQLVGFYAGFPSVASAPNWLEFIHDAARDNHLELVQGDYRIAPGEQGGLTQYRITLPLRGTYPAIRGFINTVLTQMPVASLDNVAFERQKIGDTSVQVTLHLTLYMRGGE